ncbi:MAG TPA: 50S ribosomal protein L25 [Clostridia bacterium]|nr:50S ribosomal protein L25 [Clostridia bacterium]HPQ47491.1 50S ribosomal protein L25 [Clostridia bacterium]
MSTEKLVCEKRDMAVKAKNVRKSGSVPAVLFGRNIESLSIQINQGEAAKFLKKHSVGSKVNLKIDGRNQLAILKEFQRDPLSHELLHIDFMALTEGQKIKVSLPVSYINKDTLAKDVFLQEQMSEVEISTLPKYLVDHVIVDLSGFSLGDSIHVSDLDVSKNKNIEVLSPGDALVSTLTHATRAEEEPEEEEEAPEEVPSEESAEE